MNVQLKRASSKDKKPTITVSELKGKADNGKYFYISLAVQGKTYTTVFHKTRDGQDLYAEEWDSRLPLPQTGSPLDVYLIDITRKGSIFDNIRTWAAVRRIYQQGDSKTQTLKLAEEVGELAAAVLNRDEAEIMDGIGDCVVVLTNLAKLEGYDIEEAIDSAYTEISNRKGNMVNGTFVKDGI